MFKLAVQTGGIEEVYGVDQCYRLIAETGFEAADANVDHIFTPVQIRSKTPIPRLLQRETDDKETMELFRPWKEASEKYGVENYQAHAPFPSILQDGDPGNEAYNEALMEVLRKTIVGAAYIGARNLVIHPFYYHYQAMTSLEEEWEMNCERYLRLAGTARENGVTICLENMFRGYKGKWMTGTCGDPEWAAALVDRLNELAGERVFGYCFDTGHAVLTSHDVKNFMKTMGDRIVCFHVHDNNGQDDQHLAPYMGVLDWNRFVEGLAEIGFSRTLSFETFNVWHTVDHELCPDVLKLIEKTGRMFDRRAEEIRKNGMKK